MTFQPSKWFAEECFDPDEYDDIKVHGWTCEDEDFDEFDMTALNAPDMAATYKGVGEYHVFQLNGRFVLIPKYQLDQVAN